MFNKPPQGNEMQATFFTGDLPTESMIPAQNNVRQIGYIDSRVLWSGCIDAPGYVPAGSTKTFVFDGYSEPIQRMTPRY